MNKYLVYSFWYGNDYIALIAHQNDIITIPEKYRRERKDEQIRLMYEHEITQRIYRGITFPAKGEIIEFVVEGAFCGITHFK